MALILGIRARSGGVAVTAMMAVFVVAVAQAVARGLDIECGCFGTADAAQVGVSKLLTNIGLLAISVVATLKPASPEPGAVSSGAGAREAVPERQ